MSDLWMLYPREHNAQSDLSYALRYGPKYHVRGGSREHHAVEFLVGMGLMRQDGIAGNGMLRFVRTETGATAARSLEENWR